MPRSTLPYITEAKELRGKRVLLRASLNVPLHDGAVANYFRIMRAMPTILHLTNAGAKVVLIAHMGRDPKETLRPVFEVLKEHVTISWSDEIVGTKVATAVEKLEDGSVLMLENLRTDPRERENDTDFAKELAALADIYVNDAFPVSHREHASIVGVPQHLPSYLGLTFKEEYLQLVKVMDPQSPSIFILGGAKFETKQPLVEKYIKKYDRVFVGGALANDFFKAKGYEVGESLTSDSDVKKGGLLDHSKILLPVDVTVRSEGSIRVTTPDAVESHESILDAGPATVAMLEDYIEDAAMVLWNGPLGSYEEGFAEYTKRCAEVIAGSEAFSVVGGGDTIAAIENLGLNEEFSFLSTAGGAMLEFLEKATLPGIEAVKNAPN